MKEIDFEKLKKLIEQKMNELDSLQKLYIKETGRCYIPPIKEDLKQYCTEW